MAVSQRHVGAMNLAEQFDPATHEGRPFRHELHPWDSAARGLTGGLVAHSEDIRRGGQVWEWGGHKAGPDVEGQRNAVTHSTRSRSPDQAGLRRSPTWRLVGGNGWWRNTRVRRRGPRWSSWRGAFNTHRDVEALGLVSIPRVDAVKRVSTGGCPYLRGPDGPWSPGRGGWVVCSPKNRTISAEASGPVVV